MRSSSHETISQFHISLSGSIEELAELAKLNKVLLGFLSRSEEALYERNMVEASKL